MPWRLENIFNSESKPSFVFDRKLPHEVAYGREYSVPPKEHWPLSIKQVSGGEVIPDYTTGPTTSWLMVSKRFKDLVEAWDPVEHIFVPIELERQSGTVLKDQYFFFFTQGDIEGGIDLAKSDVYEEVIGGKVVGYVNALEPPVLYWHQSKIRGRHLWSDPMFKRAIVVSDEFYTWLKKSKIVGYQAQQCGTSESEV
jgi:hypothetical protein